MKKIVEIFKKETVLSIAFILAVISAFFVPPSKDYLSYIDFRVLALLFSLMIVVCGMRSIKVFDIVGNKLLSKTKGTRSLMIIMVFLCFFLAMFVTNDVALITFVPFTIMVLKMAKKENLFILLIVLETIAANLGSMFTPIGNPQNLYLYSYYNMSLTDFLVKMLPLTVISAGLLLVSILIRKNEPISFEERENNGEKFNWIKFIIYMILFVVSILCVAHVIDYRIMLLVIVAAIIVVDIKLYKEVDYMLLLTFVCFFVFIGNMQNIPAVRNVLSELISGKELLMGVLSSQVISNVPAAILLSGFTTNSVALLYAVNIGGLGTLIASLASLISFRGYRTAPNSDRGKYMITFTIYNVIFLAVLYAACVIIL